MQGEQDYAKAPEHREMVRGIEASSLVAGKVQMPHCDFGPQWPKACDHAPVISKPTDVVLAGLDLLVVLRDIPVMDKTYRGANVSSLCFGVKVRRLVVVVMMSITTIISYLSDNNINTVG